MPTYSITVCATGRLGGPRAAGEPAPCDLPGRWERIVTALPGLPALWLGPTRALAVVQTEHPRFALELVQTGLAPPGAAAHDRTLHHIRPLLDPAAIGAACVRVWAGGRFGPPRPDPLAWPWTNLRELCGAVWSPHVDRPAAARSCGQAEPQLVGWALRELRARHGSERLGAPTPARPQSVPTESLATIARAAAAATRAEPLAIARSGPTRSAFVWLAEHQGYRDPRVLAQAIGAPVACVERIAARVDLRGLHAAAICLAEPALRGSPAPPARLELDAPA